MSKPRQPLPRVATWIVSVALALGVAEPAAAQGARGPSDTDRAAAQVLFDQGRDLMGQDKYEEACAKFAESLRLDRAIGTQLNLANCYEKANRFASAWINFEEARVRSAREGQQQREEIAAERAKALVGRLSKMTVKVQKPPKDLHIARDGELLGKAQWGLPMPVDGGKHVIEVSAPGKKPWQITVVVKDENDSVEVDVPPLKDAPIEKQPVGPGGEADDGTGMLVGAVIAGGVGIVGVGLGTAFGLLAMSKNDESLELCLPNDPTQCSAEGVDARNTALTMSYVSTGGFIAGGVGLGLGLVLFLAAPSGEEEGADQPKKAAFEWTPWVDPERREGGLMLRRSW